ncbi:c-type cytochrome [Hydrogenimonas sp.]
MKYGVLIAGAVAGLLLLGGCEKKESEAPVHEAAPAAKTESVPAPATPAVEHQKAPEAAPAAKESAETPAAEESVSQKAQEVAEEVKQKASEITKSVKEEAAAAATAVSEAVSKPAGDEAKNLFNSKCAGCHGKKGEKHALGKSNLLVGQSKALLVQKIQGYKDGTYGGAMKSIMAGQVKTLDSAQIEELAEYISTLK